MGARERPIEEQTRREEGQPVQLTMLQEQQLRDLARRCGVDPNLVYQCITSARILPFSTEQRDPGQRVAWGALHIPPSEELSAAYRLAGEVLRQALTGAPRAPVLSQETFEIAGGSYARIARDPTRQASLGRGEAGLSPEQMTQALAIARYYGVDEEYLRRYLGSVRLVEHRPGTSESASAMVPGAAPTGSVFTYENAPVVVTPQEREAQRLGEFIIQICSSEQLDFSHDRLLDAARAYESDRRDRESQRPTVAETGSPALALPAEQYRMGPQTRTWLLRTARQCGLDREQAEALVETVRAGAAFRDKTNEELRRVAMELASGTVATSEEDAAPRPDARVMALAQIVLDHIHDLQSGGHTELHVGAREMTAVAREMRGTASRMQA